MPDYTAEEAARRLHELLAKATDGEDVVITRPDEHPIHLVPGRATPVMKDRPVTQADIDWLRQRRVKLAGPVDFTAMIREMRDEDP